MDIAGKIVLLTGASEGIGLATARLTLTARLELAHDNIRVGLVYPGIAESLKSRG